MSVATLFEGFDTKLASLVLPVIGREFGAGREALGAAPGGPRGPRGTAGGPARR